jgi:DNA-directed RNA polymerase specialized sigma subunit
MDALHNTTYPTQTPGEENVVAPTNPIAEFLKIAASTRVKSHLRRSEGGLVLVKQHERIGEEPTPKAATTPKDPATAEVELRARQGKELALWRTWHDGGQQVRDLKPLLRSFRPMIRSKANVYKGRVKMIPDSAIEAEFQLRFVDALRSYDPAKGALGTYVYRYLDKAKRFIVENQNIGRIPENRVYKIKQYTTARDELNDELGRDPSVKEIAASLGWGLSEAERMDAELRSDFMTQGFEDDPYALTPSKSEEVLRLFKYELTDNERTVYEYLTGYGKPRTPSTGAIAKKMGIPDYQVSRLKAVIRKKLKRYLD